MAANIDSAMVNGTKAWWEGMDGRTARNLNRLATAAEAMTAAGLAWTVGKVPIYTDGAASDEVVQVPDYFGIKRSDTGSVLGIVGKQFEPLQNNEAFSFFDEAIGKEQAVFETAGSLGKGETVWILAKLPGDFLVGKQDKLEQYLLLANGHASNLRVTVGFTTVRVVCQNTLNLAMGRGGMFRMRHGSGIADDVRDVGKLIAKARRAFDDAKTAFERLLAKPMSDEASRLFFSCVYADAVRAANERKEQAKVIDVLSELRQNGPGADMPGVRGSLWGDLNAVTHYEDWITRTRQSTNRLNRALLGSGASIKQGAFDLALQVEEGGETVLKELMAREMKPRALAWVDDTFASLTEKPTTLKN